LILKTESFLGFIALASTITAIALSIDSNTGAGSIQSTEAATGTVKFRDAPAVVSGQNMYIAWWTNNTANNNEEVIFRASNDGGATFSDKINLSNTPAAESVDAMIAADGSNVVVTWWERNNTSEEPVARISIDAGQTFGPPLQLSNNGTIGNSEG
jgi:hypothetical protein